MRCCGSRGLPAPPVHALHCAAPQPGTLREADARGQDSDPGHRPGLPGAVRQVQGRPRRAAGGRGGAAAPPAGRRARAGLGAGEREQSFLYGHHVLKASLGRIAENAPRSGTERRSGRQVAGAARSPSRCCAAAARASSYSMADAAGLRCDGQVDAGLPQAGEHGHCGLPPGTPPCVVPAKRGRRGRQRGRGGHGAPRRRRTWRASARRGTS